MSSSADVESLFSFPITALEYRDIAAHLFSDGPVSGGRAAEAAAKPKAEVELSHEEFAERIRQERADATQQAEQRLRQDHEQKLQAARALIGTAVSAFEVQRDDYYARVEAEVVQLALAIAAKILHREAQVDPMLVAALVRIAIEKMREGSSVTIRVSQRQGAKWKQYFAAQSHLSHVAVVEDATLSDHDCVLETELGVANFGLDTQLKEVEQGFFDLLALRPTNR
jgi:flagellar assembly protein FliH